MQFLIDTVGPQILETHKLQKDQNGRRNYHHCDVKAIEQTSKSMEIERHFDCQEAEIDVGMRLHASWVGRHSISLAELLWLPALH